TAYHFVADVSFDTHFDRLGRRGDASRQLTNDLCLSGRAARTSALGLRRMTAAVKGCPMPAHTAAVYQEQQSPLGRRWTSLEGGNRGIFLGGQDWLQAMGF